MQKEQLIQTALEAGAKAAALVPVAKIHFRGEFRAACEANSCGKYGKCWMCPPDVEPIETLMADAETRQWALVFQTVGELEDSFDIEGMEAAAKRHNTVLQAVRNATEPVLKRPLVLGAGACQMCDSCARAQDGGLPCRLPEKAIASLEAYGIAVAELADACGMKYINGESSVTFFAAVLFDGENSDG